MSSPANPAAYLTYGEPIHSPCQGIVDAVEQGRPDLRVPIRDREHLEGNFVRLRCGPNVVLLAHFARQGVRVAPGQRVNVATLLGYAGNSGNTDEPHLHIHVQRPGPASAPLSGEPLFVTFEGRFLARNMIVDAAR
jgi:murein DD-endopeptidase MepM/ murein hydrolase activator NlpD